MKKILDAIVNGFDRLERDSRLFIIFAPIVATALVAIIVACWTGYSVDGASFLWCLFKGLLYGSYTYVFLNILFWVPFTFTMWVLALLSKEAETPER